MKRIYAFDFARGIAIIAVPIIHRIIWDYYCQNLTSLSNTGLGFTIFSILMGMAGIFYCISGVVNGYMSYSRIKEGKITPKQLFLKGLATGVSFILIGLFFRYFLLRSMDDVVSVRPRLGIYMTENHTGVIPYLILYGRYPTNFEVGLLFQVGTIQMIGYSIISVSIVLALYYKRNNSENIRKLRIIFMILGIIFFLIYAIINPLLSPIAQTAIDERNYLIMFFLSPITEGLFPLIPHLALGFFGAFFGVELARDDFEPKKFAKQMRIFYLVTAISGLIFMVILGITVGTDIEILDAWYNRMARKLFQLGLYFALFLLLLEIFDFQPEEKRKKRMRFTNPVKEMGRMTLTIYMLEGVLAVSLQRLIAPFWPNWNATIGNATLVGLINLAVWIGIVLIWRQFKYKGTLEHLSVALIKTFSGQKSQKIEIENE
ncbi:MAG: DUF418 domain-containing protein [Candidatus Lokiarchaeota archaeon]|nr:DUF418 domain-containing protein [Candidatus Lokiarchaeota archaeon]